MPQDDKDKLNRIEELKGRLFSKNYQMKIEHRDKFSHQDRKDLSDEWATDNKVATDPFYYSKKFFMQTSMFKKFFIASIVFFVLTLGYASYMFFVGNNTVSNENIDISVIGNNFIAGGEELSLIIGITNRNSSSLDLVDLVLEYPKSSVDEGVNSPNPTERSRVSLGTIPAGSVHDENIKLILFGEQGDVRPVKISLEYRVEGSNAIFVKERPYEVTISSTPINILVDAPSVISPNQDITLNVAVSLNATRAASKLLVKLNYPVGFQFKSSFPKPSFGNNIWSLGDLAPGGERNITISGKMIDVFDGEAKTFHVSSGSQSFSDKSVIDVVFSSLSHVVTIKKPFIEAKLFIGGVSKREYASNTQTPVNGEIRFTNNLDTTVSDLQIRAKISGNAVDRKTIDTDDGFYNSGTDTIIWDKNSINEFREIDPGQSGSVSFSVSPISLFSAGGGILSNPSINIEISISGKQLVENYAAKDLNNIESSVVHIISDVGFTAKALYYSGPFTNHGPIPPRAEQETTYTIVWSLSNTSNNISKGIIHSTIPSWMKFVGPFVPSDEDLIYNPSTREITWNVGSISKGTGINGTNRSVSFQVAFSPSLSQVGSSPVIINDATLTGYDDFANVDVKVKKGSLTIGLSSDPLFPPQGSTVAE